MELNIMLLSNLLVFLFGIGTILLLLVLVLRDSTKLPEINSRLFKVEQMLQSLIGNVQMSQMEDSFNEALKEQNESSSHAKRIYRSADGKYEADSVDKLLMMMVNDPHSSVDPNDLEALKRIFEQITKNIENDEDDEE